jgi:hypothetical protein
MVCGKAIYYQIATATQHFLMSRKRTRESSRTTALIVSAAASGALDGRPSDALKHTRLSFRNGERLLLNVRQGVAHGVELVPAHSVLGYLSR